MKLLRDIDTLLLGTALVTMLTGVVMIYSATLHSESFGAIWQKQLSYALLSGLVAILIVYLPNKLLYGLAYPVYTISLLSLVAVLFWGTGEDAARWLSLGPGNFVSLQPSEFAKISTVIVLARYLSDSAVSAINGARGFLGTLFITLVPMVLVVYQPDLGTAVFFAVILFPMLYWAGMRRLFIFLMVSPLLSVAFSFEPLWQSASPFLFAAFIIISSIAVHLIAVNLWLTSSVVVVNLAAGLITVYLWTSFLHDYQKARILTFLDPENDRLGTGWNIIQSKIAIGSGGATGKGFLQGTQTKYEFLPAAHTDFIFAAIGEEFGFLGALFVLALFFALISRALFIGFIAKNRFHSQIAIGLAFMFAFHVFVNIGMTVGVMPVTGLPLPFLSYGGSALMSNSIAVGLLLHIYANRHEY